MVRDGLAHATKQSRPFSLLLVNPCEFERLNERFGRAAGDHALREMVVRLQGALRAGDAVLRYGGAIFAVVLPGTSDTHATAVAEKVRRDCRAVTTTAGRRDSVSTSAWHVAAGRRPAARPRATDRARRCRPRPREGLGRRTLGGVDPGRPAVGLPRRSPRRGVHRGPEKDYGTSACSGTPSPSRGRGQPDGPRGSTRGTVGRRAAPGLRRHLRTVEGALGPAWRAHRRHASGRQPRERAGPGGLQSRASFGACVTGVPRHALVRERECVLAIPVRASAR